MIPYNQHVQVDRIPARHGIRMEWNDDATLVRFQATRLGRRGKKVVATSLWSGWFAGGDEEPIVLSWAAFDWPQ